MNTRPCDDCLANDLRDEDGNTPEATTHYALGAARCTLHAEGFRIEWQMKERARKAKERAALEAHIASGCPDDGITCPECCEHEFDPDEGYTCLNCGAEGYERMAAMADARSET